MTFRILNKNSYKTALLTASICIASLSIGSAWSYEAQGVSREAPAIKSFPSSTATDACKTLLVSDQQTFSGSVAVKNHRTASKIAALGVILGARFALEPNDNVTNIVEHDNKVKSDIRSAQAVAAFRKCQKEHVLAMLTDNK